MRGRELHNVDVDSLSLGGHQRPRTDYFELPNARRALRQLLWSDQSPAETSSGFPRHLSAANNGELNIIFCKPLTAPNAII